MSKKNSKKQKMYKMKGCSKTRKNYLGGSSNAPLAYTGKSIFSLPNPNLAYTGKGGSSCGLSNTSNIPINTNATSPAYPNTGPVSAGVNTIYNNASSQLGGCGCSAPLIGGKRKTKGGANTHRKNCRCSQCKTYNTMKGGNTGMPYPDGLVGSPWQPSVTAWPGVNGIPGDSNYYAVNTYNNDISRQMVDIGANRPFLKGGKQKQKGGAFIAQDLLNLGRQFQFGVGSAYNALSGYSSPVNPLPWKDQIPTNTSINARMI